LPPALAGGLFNIVKLGFSRTILAKAFLDHLILLNGINPNPIDF
jgi:hypothetical protein